MNHLENPMGYFIEKLTFSWNVTGAAGIRQKACRVQIFADPMTQSSAFDTGICKDEEAESEIQYFETDKGAKSWTGKWISCDSSQSRLPVFYRKVDLKKTVRKARLYGTV